MKPDIVGESSSEHDSQRLRIESVYSADERYVFLVSRIPCILWLQMLFGARAEGRGQRAEG